jgi:hypothetical protein
MAWVCAFNLEPPEAVMRPAMLFAVLCSLMACGGGDVPGLPTAPSELGTGVVLYEHANFLGASGHVTSDVPDLEGLYGPCRHSDATDGEYYDWNHLCVLIASRARLARRRLHTTRLYGRVVLDDR